MDLLEKYLENLRINKGLAYLTIEGYRTDIEEYLNFLEKNKRTILDSNEDLFQEYFKILESKYKKSSFGKKYSALRGFYKYLLRHRNITEIYEYKETTNEGEHQTVNKDGINFTKQDYYNFIDSLNNDFSEERIKLICKLAIEYKISLADIFEIQIKDLVKYDFQKIVVLRNSKIISHNIDEKMAKFLKKYYEEHAFEKRFLFGAYSKMVFTSDLKKYGLTFKMLKSSMVEDEEEMLKKIREMYFEIGIGDKE